MNIASFGKSSPSASEFGDPKISDTIGWEDSGVDAWRASLQRDQKEYVRTTCLDVFRAMNYDPSDD